MPYADTLDYAEYMHVEESTLSTDLPRLLDRASELLDYYLLNGYDDTDADHIAALKLATCQQIEYWLVAGENPEFQGAVSSFTIGKTSMAFKSGGSGEAQPELAPRANRTLMRAGLLYKGVSMKRGGHVSTPQPFGQNAGLSDTGRANSFEDI